MSGVYSWRLLQQRDWVRHLEFVVLFFVDNINNIIIHRVLYVWELKGIIIICIHSPIYSWTDPSPSLSPDGFIQWHVLYAVYCINKHGGNDGQSINVNCQCLLLLLLRLLWFIRRLFLWPINSVVNRMLSCLVAGMDQSGGTDKRHSSFENSLYFNLK